MARLRRCPRSPAASRRGHRRAHASRWLAELDIIMDMSHERWTVMQFGAEWSAACLVMQKVYVSLARDYPAAIRCHIDVDKSPDLAQRFGATRVPSYELQG